MSVDFSCRALKVQKLIKIGSIIGAIVGFVIAGLAFHFQGLKEKVTAVIEKKAAAENPNATTVGINVKGNYST